MNPGAMDQRIQFQSHGTTDDGYGGQTDAWSDVGSPVWCRIVPKSGAEDDDGGQITAMARYTITMWHDTSVALDASMRIRWVTNGDKILNIREFPDPGERALKRMFEAEEGVAT